MERCYDLPDEANILAVTSETNKRRESPAVATSVANGHP